MKQKKGKYLFGSTVARLLAERMWMSWHPPFACNAQRLSEKWTACGDLLERKSRGGQEVTGVFRMTLKTVS